MNCEDIVPRSDEHFKEIKRKLIASAKKLVYFIEKHHEEFGELTESDDEFLKKMKEALIIFKSLEYKDE